MIDNNVLSKIIILFQQEKFAEAERILKDLLSQDVNNTMVLALLAEASLKQDKTEQARKFIDNAIGLEPHSSNLFFIKAQICIDENNLDDAEKFLNQSIELDPSNADGFALLGFVKLTRKQYQKALELTGEALQLDSENLLALNTRSTALIKLNKKDEAFQTIEGALREDPNNAYTHANYGWSLLEKGDHKKAKVHFKEALQNNPNYEFAQAGLLEALKASNPIYRIFLRYSFFMNNLTANYQWLVIIGFLVGMRVLRSLANNYPALQPFVIPLIIVLALFAFSTWIITPVSNLFLRFNKYGNLLLSQKQKISSNLVALCTVFLITGLLIYLIKGDYAFLTISIFGLVMMLPFSLIYAKSKIRNAFFIYAVAMTGVGMGAIAITFRTGEYFNPLTVAFVIGFIAFQWIANFILIQDNNE